MGDVIVNLKIIHVITDEGFTIYNESFGATEQEQEMVLSILMAMRETERHSQEGLEIPAVDFGEGLDMILESGIRVSAIAVVVLDKDNKEREEYEIRKVLLNFVRKFGELYAEELIRAEINTKIAQNGAEYARMNQNSPYKVGEHPTLKTLDEKTFSKIKALSDFLCHLSRLKYRLSEDVELIEELINESARIQEIDLSFTLDQALSSTGERLMYYWRVDS